MREPTTASLMDSDGALAGVLSRRDLERRSEAEIAEHVVRAMPGVVNVHNRLQTEWNDTTHPRQTQIFG